MGDGQEKLLMIFREAVKSLAEDFRPGETQRAAKKRRHHAALTIEMLRKKLIVALDEIEQNIDPDSVVVSIDLNLPKDKKQTSKKPSKPKKEKDPIKTKATRSSPTKKEKKKKEVKIIKKWSDLF
jgi:hypothetical protein